MRAFIMSLDSIIAITILLAIAAFLASLQFSTTFPELTYEKNYYVAKDVITIFKHSTISDLQSYPVVSQMLLAGILGSEDFDKTLLDVVGSFWAQGNDTYAFNLVNGTIGLLAANSSIGLEILFDNQSVFNTSSKNFTSVTRTSTIVSGISKGKPVSGYVSRAFASNIRKNNTLVVMGDIITSSVRLPSGYDNNNRVNLTYNFVIPNGSNITKASGYYADAWTDTFARIFINGKYITEITGTGTLSDIKSSLVIGNNTIVAESRFNFGGYEGGDDGSTHWIINYNTTQFQTDPPKARFYFEAVKSKASIRYKKPIFITGSITNMSVQLNLSASTLVNQSTLKFVWKGQEVTIGAKKPVAGIISWNDSVIRPAVQSLGLSYSDLSDRFFWFVVDVDKYNSREITSYDRQILSSSYVEVVNNETIPYSYIDLNQQPTLNAYSNEDPQLSGFYRYMMWKLNLSSQSDRKSVV